MKLKMKIVKSRIYRSCPWELRELVTDGHGETFDQLISVSETWLTAIDAANRRIQEMTHEPPC